jgi:hypothetical protein
MFDTGGDGWQGTIYTIRNSTSGTTLAEGEALITGEPIAPCSPL